MLEKKIKQMISEQVSAEFYSAYLYLDFANYYMEKGLDGFATWFEAQAKEELEHGMMMRSYLHDHGDTVVFESIKKPDGEYKNIREPLVLALEHEKFITSKINEIYKTALASEDFCTVQFYGSFVKEQLEEERNAGTLIEEYDFYCGEKSGLYLMNKSLGQRKS